MNNFFVYILKCNDSSYYTGHTDNLEMRIVAHKDKYFEGYTAVRLPIDLVSVQPFATRDEAFNAERQIKGWSRQKKEALIKENWNEIIRLSNK